MKICTKCKLPKELSEFYRHAHTKDGRNSSCKKCDSDHRIEKKLIQTRNSTLKSSYGLNEEALKQMYIDQEGKCLVCGVFKTTYSRHGGLYIDHCHATGVVRGLLCNRCNVMLGLANDDVGLLLDAIRYLDTHKSKKG